MDVIALSLMFSQLGLLVVLHSKVRRIVHYKFGDVSKNSEWYNPWQCDPPKRRWISAGLHDTIQQMNLLISLVH